MTKSFTATAVVRLRDEGRLRLDEPAATYVPELAGLRGPTTDSPAITLRHLLTMSAGLPEDDPWGDRLQDLDAGGFDALLRAPKTFAWVPGTAFEYSNLSYAILGRAVTNVAGIPFWRFISEQVLGPMGMAATVWTADAVSPDRLAHGYRRDDDAWVEEPFADLGAFAAMGGLFSSVRDLALWVGGWCDAWPPRDDPEGNAPLSRASRREMQQPWRPAELEITREPPGAVPVLSAGSYGFGLFAVDDLRIGRVVGHSGGYPGYGSHMRWPALERQRAEVE